MAKTDTPTAVEANMAGEETGLADPGDMELLGELLWGYPSNAYGSVVNGGTDGA